MHHCKAAGSCVSSAASSAPPQGCLCLSEGGHDPHPLAVTLPGWGVPLSLGSPGIAVSAGDATQLHPHKLRRVDVFVTALCDCRICIFAKRGGILGTLNLFLT